MVLEIISWRQRLPSPLPSEVYILVLHEALLPVQLVRCSQMEKLPGIFSLMDLLSCCGLWYNKDVVQKDFKKQIMLTKAARQNPACCFSVQASDAGVFWAISSSLKLVFQINHYPAAWTVWHLPFNLTRIYGLLALLSQWAGWCHFSRKLESGYLEIIFPPCWKLWTLAGLEKAKQ